MCAPTLLISLLYAAAAHPQDTAKPPATKPHLQSLAAKTRAEADVPALGLVVMHAGERPAIAVDGVRVVGGETKVTPDDLWHLGSITKSFTATLVARLVEQGKVSWDDTVGARLGGAVPNIHKQYRDVTFMHLLSHRSGLQANIPGWMFASFAAEPEDRIADRLRWVKIALEQEPVGPKEETYEYSNNGFIVAGAMLESATGQSWEDLMRKEVFGPLGLKSAGFGGPQGDTPDAQPRGHRTVDGKRVAVPPDADNPPALGPAGRIHMSLADLATYLSVHAAGREGFLTKASYERLHTTPFGGNYALGWVVISPEGRWHNGSNTMWYAEAVFDRDNHTVAAVAVNDGTGGDLRNTVRALLHGLMRE